jgi:hypothetical protein
MTTKRKETVSPEFLSHSDRDDLGELVFDWLNENGHKPRDSYAFSIIVEWEEE